MATGASFLTFGQAMNGTVVGTTISTTIDEWIPGKLVLVDIPTLTKTNPLSGTSYANDNVMGPCFSPETADSIAFFHCLNGTSEIWIVKSDGSSTQPLKTGISYAGTTNDGASALYWLRLSNGDYFYWMDQSKGVCRCRAGDTATEVLVAGRYFWGGFSLDGTRAASARKPWTYVDKIDLVAKTSTGGWRGCNASVSPDGTNLLMNLASNDDNIIDGQRFGEGECARIRNWSSTDIVSDVCDIQCSNDMIRWSHFDNHVWMFRNYRENRYTTYKICPVDYADYSDVHGAIYNYVTGERINMGLCVGFDYYPGKISSTQTAVADPVINPAAGELPATTTMIHLSTYTTGASIRYTVDGTSPSATAGTLATANDSFPMTLSFGSSRTVKAVAFKSGMISSNVVSATYTGHDTTPGIVITAPSAGQVVHIGDTLQVRWTNKPSLDEAGMVLSISIDLGLRWEPMFDRAITAQTAGWQNVSWLVPGSILDGAASSTEAAMISIAPYGAPSMGVYSECFTIQRAPVSARCAEDVAGAVRSPLNGLAVKVYDITGRLLPNSTTIGTTDGTLCIVWTGTSASLRVRVVGQMRGLVLQPR